MKNRVYLTQSSHMDLFWMGRMERCMELGAEIIDDAVKDLEANPNKYFLIETVRFLEFYLDKHPEKKEIVRKLMQSGHLEVGAAYVDRLENHHDGESLVRNAIYGKKVLHEMLGIDTDIAAHPDLPGLCEQTPQIYHKCNIRYYTFSRGYRKGARFIWSALNERDEIEAYNYPVHYSYYNYHEVFENLNDIRQAISDPNPLICFSAGDLGYYGTFIRPDDVRVTNDSIVKELQEKYPELDIRYSGVHDALESMSSDDLPVYSGECPSKWGTYGSATNVESFQQDKKLSALLADAEKIDAFCSLLHIPTDSFEMMYPFCLMQKPHMLRDYYDSKIKPKSISDWIEFAWRLQIITQDHNYGGIDGVCSAFDRKIYKKIGIEIAENIIQYCMERLSSSVQGDWDKIAVNVCNWDVTGKIYMDHIETGTRVEDSHGNVYITGMDKEGVYFQPTIKALSYETFFITHKIENNLTGENSPAIWQEDSYIVITNSFYKVIFDKKLNGITSIIDRENGKELLGEQPVGIFTLFEDYSNDVHELAEKKNIIDTTRERHSEIKTGVDSQAVWLSWTTHILDSKVLVKLELNRVKKEFTITPEIYWVGHDNSQLRFSFGLNPEFQDLYYGVPYGIQKYGNYMQGAEPTNPSDEISMPLFHEYREVQGWYGLQGDGNGICISTNQSSVAFCQKNEIEMVLVRDVVSCGDADVMMDNHGHHIFRFACTSFNNNSITETDKFYKASVEAAHPFLTCGRKKEGKSVLPAGGTVLTVNGGILSVLQRNDEGYLARIFSVTKKEKKLSIQKNGAQVQLKHCNLLKEEINEDSVMRFGDIKTVLF